MEEKDYMKEIDKSIFDFEIDVVGTRYRVYVYDDQTELMREGDIVGVCEYSSHSIHVARGRQYEETIRHELIHAFMYECGNNPGYGELHSEKVVTFFGLQFEKIRKLVDDTEYKARDALIKKLTKLAEKKKNETN